MNEDKWTIKEPAILFVDDEKHVLKSLNRLFFDEDYQIFLAESGKEGLEILKNDEIHVIVSDQRMPEMHGVDFLIASQDISPKSIKILLTGYSDLVATQRAINEGNIYKYMNKPWQDEEMKLNVKRALELFDLQRKNEELLELSSRQNEELKEFNKRLNDKVKDRTRIVLEKNKELNDLNKKLSENLTKVIRVFLNLIELHSPDIGNHSKRVAASSRFIASEYELSDEETNIIEIAALLHDIGKIGLPGRILKLVESRMNIEDLHAYQKHPIAGQNAIEKIDNMGAVGMIIRHHHEKYNGGGFPDGLMGEEIPVGARVIAVADTYDKLFNRVYQNSKNTRARAIIAIKEMRGWDLDGEIVDLMMNVLDKGEKDLHRSTVKGKVREELELRPFELRENMVLSRDLFTSRGNLVLAKGRRIDKTDIKIVLDEDRLEKLLTSVYVLA